MIARLVEGLWYGHGAAARVARAVLSPASRLFEAAATRRARAFDRGEMEIVTSTVPVISVGNVSVGGTGKTPFAAMLVDRLRAMGRSPALVMRGYGGDEPVLHEWLNPGVRVYVDVDRARGIAHAAANGADVVVLDDAYQHRRAARDLDIVLVSVDRWRDDMQLLPAGPLREPLSALARAGLVVLTVKRASAPDVEHARAEVQRAAPGVSSIVVEFSLDTLREAAGDRTLQLTELGGASVLAVAGVADPDGFFVQLERAGARVTRAAFADHHAYSRKDVQRLARRAAGHKYVVTTGKDAVKLTASWPANAPPLWYVSQAVTVSDGESLLDAALRRAVAR